MDTSSPASPASSRWFSWVWLAGTALAYALLAKVFLDFYSSNGLVTVFWPGAGVSLAAVLLGGNRFAGAIFLGSVMGHLWVGAAPGIALTTAIANTLDPLLGAWLLTRKGHFDVSLSRSRDFFRLCWLAGVVSPGAGALVIAGTQLYAGLIDPSEFWYDLTWEWMGDGFGVIAIAPLILVWRRLPEPRRVAETLAVFGLSILAGQAIFLDWFHEMLGAYYRAYWMYLIVSWAAVRLGLHSVLLLAFITILQALAGIALGRGYFGNELLAVQLVNAWIFMISLVVVGASLATVFAERERVTAQLRASEKRYRALFENMLDGFAHCRMMFRDGVPVDYEFIAVNPAFEKILGLAKTAGRRFGEIAAASATGNATLMEVFARVVQSGEPEHWEHFFPEFNRWLWLAVYRPAPGEFVVISKDVTKRRQAEEGLRKLSLAVEQSPVSIVITDLAGRIEYVNPAFTAASGYSAAEATGSNPRLLKSGRTPSAIYDELWATVAAGNVWRGELINRRKDGTEYCETVTISPLRCEDGQVTHYVGVKTDITELKQAIAALEIGENRLQLAKTAARLAIFDRDIINDVYSWDERARQLWGIGPDEPVNFATFIAGVHPDDHPAVHAAVARATDPRGTGEYAAEYRVINRKDGSVRSIVASGQAFFTDGRAVRIVGTIKDVSAKKKLEKELLDRRNELEQLLKREVAAHTAAAIAHELNQPLVSISAYSEAALRMLSTGVKNPEKLARALEGAMEQSQRAGRTLHELLDFLHHGDAVTEPVDLNAMIYEALAVTEESRTGEFRPVLDLRKGLPPVMANRLQLQKVLVNLIHNSIEAMRSSGMPAAEATITIRTGVLEDMARLTVQDNGPGFDTTTAQHMFDHFFTTRPNGIGLGLAISRALVKAHGGQLWAEASAGSGATFHFTLPFAS